MSQLQLESLIRMVNQIGANNSHHENDELAAEAVANHLKKFWARSMKRQLADYAERDGEQLSPISKKAVEKLRDITAPSSPPGR
jgi:formate dehydrogenase subunit delta